MKIETIRHSLSHILAYAVQELYPGTKFGIGPAIEKGFYYDFDNLDITDKDLEKIEDEIKKIIAANYEFKREVIPRSKSLDIFKDEPYKLELINDLEDDYVSIYTQGEFTDLCRGPHIPSTGLIKSVKLTKIAGAYWKGDSNNKMLTRIYGISFPSEKQLNDYLNFLEEAKKRDHRILGKKLELFIFDEEVGQGLPLWLPKGAILYHIIENYLYEELLKEKYQWVKTPHIANIKLWEISGHLSFYKENMYSPIKIDDEKYQLKPMNCPFHLKIYRSKIRSWRDMPLKFAELGTVYRYEKSGVLHGLTRVRGFTQDDAHIFCTPEQLSNCLLYTSPSPRD